MRLVDLVMRFFQGRDVVLGFDEVFLGGSDRLSLPFSRAHDFVSPCLYGNYLRRSVKQ